MRRSLIVLILLALAVVGLVTPGRSAAQTNRLCFNVPGITNCIEGRFRTYWEQNGGLAVFGYPLSAAAEELNRDTGKTYLTQWFERNRFELHPENQAPYDVLLGRLGDDRLVQQGRPWQNEPRESGPKPGCLWFEQTGHNVCNDESGQAPALSFRSYWQNHGLTDPRLDQMGRSLALFGLPLTAPRPETNADGDTVLTQWFERARFEWHPGQPREFRVLLGRLGNEVRNGGNGGERPSGRIVYVSAKDIFTGGDLYSMKADGSEQTRLTFTGEMPLEGAEYALSPAGDRIAYRLGERLMVARLDGPDTSSQEIARTNMVNPAPGELFAPTWAPDGSYLAYLLNNDIYATRADGSPSARVTTGAGIPNPSCLSWARSGYLAFRTPAMHTFKIFVVRSDGSDLHQVGWGLCPVLSPSGDRISYLNGFDLWLMNSDGSNPHALTSGSRLIPGSWSPDGTQIVTVRTNSDNPYDRDIVVVDGASGAIHQLTTDPNLDVMPAWSPDGKFITFASKRTLRYGIYRMRADGSEQTLLATPAESSSPQWAGR